jgi:adenylate kinase
VAGGERSGAPARRIVLLGPPSSGKGTQAKRIAERLEIPAISTGDMLRQARDAGTALGKRVGDILAAGELVDDDTMAEVVEDRLARPDARDGFLLDGYPRTPRQVRDLEKILAGREPLDAVVLIDVPEEVLVARALGRGREDDREEIVRKRIEVYREKTEPLVAHYGNLGLLEEVDGDRPIEEVTVQILRVLGVAGETGD